MKTRNDIQQVNIQLNSMANEFGWDFELGNTLIYTPTECSIRVKNNNKIQLLSPYGIKSNKTWKDIYDIYKLSCVADNIHISLLQDKDIKNRSGDISGLITIDNENPDYLNLILDSDTLPISLYKSTFLSSKIYLYISFMIGAPLLTTSSHNSSKLLLDFILGF